MKIIRPSEESLILFGGKEISAILTEEKNKSSYLMINQRTTIVKMTLNVA